MVVFNYLVPAFILNSTVQNPMQIGGGSISTGGTLNLGHAVTGTMISEPGFETQINAQISNANDWPTVDPDGQHTRPNLLGLLTTDDGEYIQVTTTGIQTPTAEVAEIVTGKGTGSLAFGSFQSVFLISFRTGAAKYKNLEDSIFVASQTVKSLDSKTFLAGLRISKVYSTKTNVTID